MQFDSHTSQLDERRKSPPSNSAQRRKHAQQIKQLHRRLQLWVPNNKYVTVTGIITDNDTIVEGPQAVLHALRDQWSPIFERREVCHQSISQLFAHVPLGSWDWSMVKLPTEESIHKVIMSNVDSGTGPDGIPNSAWKPLGKHGALLLYNITLDMCTDKQVPHGFNYVRKCFVPKKKYITHKGGIAARSSDLRPLGLKNSDAKTVSAAMNYSLAPVASKCAHFSQRGFVRSRNFVLNAIELDTFARIFSTFAASGSCPPEFFPLLCAFLCFFDFLAAFPSVAHEFLFRALEFYGCPFGIRNFIESLFMDVVAFTSAGGLQSFFA